MRKDDDMVSKFFNAFGGPAGTGGMPQDFHAYQVYGSVIQVSGAAMSVATILPITASPLPSTGNIISMPGSDATQVVDRALVALRKLHQGLTHIG